MKSIIYHIPFKINYQHPSGTNERPLKMLAAFKALGCDVVFIEGSAKERKTIIRSVRKQILGGRRFDFVYSESSTEPTLLTEHHHLPIHFRLDFGFFKFCKSYGIPIGLFYRDIYWRFPFYGVGLHPLKRAVAKFFYRYDLRQYNRYVSLLYLPSLRIADYLPEKLVIPLDELPPGIEETAIDTESWQATRKSEVKKLRLLYVGGLGGHYVMPKLFEAVAGNERIELTFCCRSADWEQQRGVYEHLLSDNIKVIHKQKAELLPLFETADLAVFFIEPSEYMSFAVPLKLFEYMGHGKPVITSKHTATADFVEKNEVGWSIDYSASAMKTLLKSILDRPDSIDTKVAKIKEIVYQHTWRSRAEQLISQLSH